MIKYEETGKKYKYNEEDLENLLEIINSGKFWDENYCTKEKVEELLKLIDNFINNTKEIITKVIKERKETEEEAQEYFGEKFVKQFNALLTKIDQEETLLAIHGTTPEALETIMKNGLKYKTNSITATSVIEELNFGQRPIKYKYFSELLNWSHEQKKGLILIGIPYECTYKEPLWEKIGVSYTGSEFTSKIKSEFIIGYIDVENKQIILNPNYNRNHNYEGLVFDTDIYSKRNITNEDVKKEYIEFQKKIKEIDVNDYNPSVTQEDYDLYNYNESPFENVSTTITEEINPIIRSIGLQKQREKSTILNEFRYKNFLSEINNYIKIIQKGLPYLKTEEQVRNENKQKDNNKSYSYGITNDKDFSDDEEWDYDMEFYDDLEDEELFEKEKNSKNR